MKSLISAGFLEKHGQRSAFLTPEGINRGDDVLRARLAAEPLDLSWGGVEPVLKALWESWLARGAPATGIAIELVAQAWTKPLRLRLTSGRRRRQQTTSGTPAALINLRSGPAGLQRDLGALPFDCDTERERSGAVLTHSEEPSRNLEGGMTVMRTEGCRAGLPSERFCAPQRSSGRWGDRSDRRRTARDPQRRIASRPPLVFAHRRENQVDGHQGEEQPTRSVSRDRLR